MQNFEGFALPEALINTLNKIEYKAPTPIQAKTIPLALEGRDILGSAQTGTGKTGAFTIPILAKLMSNPRGSALIMLPTRELAVQVVEVVKKMLGTHSTIKTALLIGGEAMHPQFKQLQMRPRIIVGTPGRINDHLERGSLKLHDAGILVLDETDRMLDMGFGIQIDKILKFVPKVRQTLLFSATLPKNIMSMAAKYLNNPERIEVGSNNTPIANIKQEIINTTPDDKYGELVKQLNGRDGSIIIFVKTKRGADKLAHKLTRESHSADAIHGDLPQKKRDRVIKAFRDKQHRILVATDVAARGLDIEHIEHVINYDLPMQPEDYIHRIGRTARNGKEGSALCLVTSEDRGKMNAINRLINPSAKPERFNQGEGKGDNKYAKKRSFGGGKKSGGGKFGQKKRFGSETNGGKFERDERPAAEKSFGERPARKEGFKRQDDGAGKQRFRAEGDFRDGKPRNFGGERREGFRGERRERPAGENFHGERSERPRGEGFRGNREGGSGEKRREGGFRGDKRNFDGERPARKEGEFKPRGDRPQGDKPFGERKFGGKPGGRKFGNGGSKFGGGHKKFGGKPGGGKFGGGQKTSGGEAAA